MAGKLPNSGGVIRNNMIYHAANNHAFADSAHRAGREPEYAVYNNSVYYENSYPVGDRVSIRVDHWNRGL